MICGCVQPACRSCSWWRPAHIEHASGLPCCVPQYVLIVVEQESGAACSVAFGDVATLDNGSSSTTGCISSCSSRGSIMSCPGGQLGLNSLTPSDASIASCRPADLPPISFTASSAQTGRFTRQPTANMILEPATAANRSVAQESRPRDPSPARPRHLPPPLNPAPLPHSLHISGVPCPDEPAAAPT